MLIIVGGLIVLCSTLGGFLGEGGNPLVLLQPYELVVILGVAAGILVIASPGHVLTAIISKFTASLKGGRESKAQCFDLLKLLYELFNIARRNGLIALDEHLNNPESSAIFQKYPSVLSHHERLVFICGGLKPIVDGKIKPDMLDHMMESELDAKAEEAEHPIHVLQLVGDSLPGVGIVAAVLGIINTMGSINEGPAKVGEHVAAALVGTLLGIFVAYGFVNPLANRIKFANGSEAMFLRLIKVSICSFAKGLAPLTAVESARRILDHSIQPTAQELEDAAKATATTAKS